MFEKFDKTGRVPRGTQVQALKWIEDNWDSRVLALNLPTGVGKSAIAKAVQIECQESAIIVPSNILLDQYVEIYPTDNFLKGASHYTCEQVPEISCQDKKVLSRTRCPDCPYQKCRQAAIDKVPTIFNPLSYHYSGMGTPKVLIIDEAHKLISLIMLLVTQSFRHGQYNYPKIDSSFDLLAWLYERTSDLTQEIDKAKAVGDMAKAALASRRRETTGMVIKAFREQPENFAVYEKEAHYHGKMDRYLIIEPINPPRWILRSFLPETVKIILLSATLIEDNLLRLGLHSFKYIDFDSPIPKSRRPIKYVPAGFTMNYQTPPDKAAEYIKGILDKHPGENTVIHVSYGWSAKLAPYFPDAYVNTAENKPTVMEKFKRDGGIWLAAGCAEGIDLPDDMCRVIIIPFIVMGNPTDPVVSKSIALPGGQLRYYLQAITTVIQQAGRGSRSETDFCVTYIGDSKFPNLVLKFKKYLPKSFLSAIQWR